MASYSQEKKNVLLVLKSVLWYVDAAQPTRQVNGDRRWAEERGRLAVELKVLRALAPGPYVP